MACGTTPHRLGWPGQAPGHVARAMLFQKVLSESELEAVYNFTKAKLGGKEGGSGAGAGGGAEQQQQRVDIGAGGRATHNAFP